MGSKEPLEGVLQHQNFGLGRSKTPSEAKEIQTLSLNPELSFEASSEATAVELFALPALHRIFS